MKFVFLQGAHDAEILSLGFNLFNKKDMVPGIKDNNHLLSSGGRDRIIHVYDVKRFSEVFVFYTWISTFMVFD